jgi:hypothetical protein
MYRVYGLVLFVVGIGFILLGGYLLYAGYIGYTGSPLDWQSVLIVAGVCLFGYLLVIAGYRMSRGNRF